MKKTLVSALAIILALSMCLTIVFATGSRPHQGGGDCTNPSSTCETKPEEPTETQPTEEPTEGETPEEPTKPGNGDNFVDEDGDGECDNKPNRPGRPGRPGCGQPKPTEPSQPEEPTEPSQPEEPTELQRVS